MRKKALLVLLAAMTLTVASVGTAFAYEDNGDIASQSETEEHTHTWGEDVKVVDKEAVWEHKDAVYSEPEWVEPVYGEDKWVIDQEAVYQDKYELMTVCNNCYANGIIVQLKNNMIVGTGETWAEHALKNGCGSYGQHDILVGQELVTPEQGHWEKGDLISEGYWTDPVLVSPAEDILVSAEEFHYEHTCTVCGEIQNRDTGEVIQQGSLSGQPTEPVVPNDPNTPQDTPENNVTDDPNTPQTTPDNTPNTETNVTETSTSQNNTTTGNTTGAAAVNTSESKKSPKTGDGTGTMSLLTLVGGALTGGTALAFRKRLAK